MYYIAKIFQAAGLAVFGIGFIIRFPKLVDHKTLFVSLVAFGLGWSIERIIAK